MQPKNKAALLSAFVFPGAGQFYLKRKKLGVAFILCSSIALLLVIGLLMGLVRDIMDQILAGTLTPSIEVITQEVLRFANSPEGEGYARAKWGFVVIWIAAIGDAYIAGGQQATIEQATAEKKETRLL